ncbi:MAG: hypothetical protein CMP65_05095 [Flavobacteriales bacterium]|nr:hypothetical protein [Flavobacteriales bacterium]|tara:strand:+ start:4828 stop:5286 length:459 start_codon:yes stop_codon:yes gene_type:complete
MVHQLHKQQYLKANIESVWDFASSPKNLKIITPEYMNFKILSPNLPEKMYPGMIISYTVSPVLNINMNWITEITQISYKKYFVDEQKSGPYSLWHHQHIFEEKNNGVLMTDIVTYKIPFGPLGDLVNKIYIRNKLESIFNYRYLVMERIFNS